MNYPTAYDVENATMELLETWWTCLPSPRTRGQWRILELIALRRQCLQHEEAAMTYRQSLSQRATILWRQNVKSLPTTLFNEMVNAGLDVDALHRDFCARELQ